MVAIHVDYVKPRVLLEQERDVLVVLHDLDGIAAHVNGAHQAKGQAMARVIE
jgi:hypothetical protein